MEDRIFRFSGLGIVLCLSGILGFWMSGGDVSEILKKLSDLVSKDNKLIEILLSALALLIATPISGYIISTVIHACFAWADRTPFCKCSINSRERHFFSHQANLRQEENSEAIKFSTRRYDSFWTNINISCSIIAGIMVGSLARIYLCITSDLCPLQRIYCLFISAFDGHFLLKLFAYIFIVNYICLSVALAIKSKYEADAFERCFLYKQSR